ncbi:unnamed protein product [Cuscuta campestris]|uniref:Beta-glucosidase n=1 Tax=Cuscuta campestris TaxID=132261 RepID=A0A484MME1_9ASTE|nr:unnamed protein product [Cuscuta campestris]
MLIAFRYMHAGIGDPVDLSLQDAAKDTWRINYHGRHLLYIRQAICDHKVRVEGYFVWTCIDNLEWSSGYTIRMGLYNVDRSTKELTRSPKWSAKIFHDFLNRNGHSRGGGGHGEGGGDGIVPDVCRRLIPIRPKTVTHDEL